MFPLLDHGGLGALGRVRAGAEARRNRPGRRGPDRPGAARAEVGTQEDGSVAQAQFHAFARKMPSFYTALIVSHLSLAWVFHTLVPAWLTAIPLATSAICSVRGVYWWRHRGDEVSEQVAVRAMRRATKLTTLLAVMVVGWDLMAWQYGDAPARTVLLFFLGTTGMYSLFCLMHVRRAAMIVVTVMLVPFLLMVLALGMPGSAMLALDMTWVTAAMVAAMLGYYEDFASLARSRLELMTRRAEAQRLSDENHRIANLDALTGLPNRRRFFAELEAAHARAAAAGRTLAVGVLDLDGFKPINDAHGHVAGDKVLAEVAARLVAAPRASHGAGLGAALGVFRLGGDEFAILVEAATREETAEAALLGLGHHLVEAVSGPVALGELRVAVSCSVGFAVYPDAAPTPELLYERADYALYQAKRTGRGRAVLFNEAHERTLRDAAMVEQALRVADLERELYLVYQPITDLRTGRTLAFEALARWSSPRLGEVSPARFVTVAENTGLIGSLTPVLLAKALAAAAHWPDAVRLSFNLSAHDVGSPETMLALVAVIERSPVSPRRISVELTETAVMRNAAQAHAGLAMLKAMGVAVSLDDFGTGYSSLSHVHTLPLDTVKVDGSFVRDLDTNPASRTLVRALSALCRDMGLACVVEGVETASQASVLAEIGCDLVQGYYVARPMPEERVAAYLTGCATGLGEAPDGHARRLAS